MQSCEPHNPASETGIIPEILNTLRRVLEPFLASSSPCSSFHTHRIFQGQGGSHRSAFSRPVCYQGHTLLSVLENQITDVTNGKSQVLVVQGDLGRREAAPLSLPKQGIPWQKWRSPSQALKTSSCYLHLLHLLPQGPAQWLQQFSAKAEMMKCSQGWISRSRFGWWEHTQLMPTSKFDDRLL